MANDSQKLVILKQLTAHLQTINPDDGNSDYDLKCAVFRGRLIYGQDSPLPMVSILEAPRAVAGLAVGENKIVRKDEWELLIQGWVKDDVDNPTDPAYGLLDAVENKLKEIVATSNEGMSKPLFPKAYLLGNTIISLEYGQGIVRPPTEGVSSKAFFYLPVRVGIAVNQG